MLLQFPEKLRAFGLDRQKRVDSPSNSNLNLKIVDCAWRLTDGSLFVTHSATWAAASEFVGCKILARKPLAFTPNPMSSLLMPVFELALGDENTPVVNARVLGQLFDVLSSRVVATDSFSDLLALSLALHTTSATFVLIEHALREPQLARCAAPVLASQPGFFHHFVDVCVREFKVSWIVDIVPPAILRNQIEQTPILDAQHAVALAAAGVSSSSCSTLKRCTAFLTADLSFELQRLVVRPPAEFPIALFRALIGTNLIDVLRHVKLSAERMRANGGKAVAKEAKRRLQKN